jgi:predicted amidohydrolase YtcJ
MRLAGITKDTPNPPGGEIVRDPTTGDASGVFKEDPADEIMNRAIRVPTHEEKLQAFRAGLKAANQVGLVRVHSASGDLQTQNCWRSCTRPERINVPRVSLSLLSCVAAGVTAAQFAEIEGARRKYR